MRSGYIFRIFLFEDQDRIQVKTKRCKVAKIFKPLKDKEFKV